MVKQLRYMIFAALFLCISNSAFAVGNAVVAGWFDTACDLAGSNELEREQAFSRIVAEGSSKEDFFIERLTDKQTVKKQIAAKILGEVGGVKAEAALIKALDDDDVFLRGAAARALTVLYTRLDQAILATRLLSTDMSLVRMAVLYGAYKRARYGKRVLNTKLLGAVIAVLNKTKNVDEIEAAVMVLRFAESQEAVVGLLEVLKRSDNTHVQIDVCRALTEIAPLGEAQVLEALAVCGKPEVEVEALAALSAMGYKNTAKALVVLATYPTPIVQARAIEVLSKSAGMEYLHLYVAALRSDQGLVRLEALYALLRVGGIQATTEIAKMMGPDGDEDPFVRAMSALAFNKLNHSGGLMPLLKDAQNEEGNKLSFRIEAIKALGMLGDSGALRTLIDLLDNADQDLRVAAINALGELGDKRAVKSLQEKTKVREGEELVAIKEALLALQ